MQKVKISIVVPIYNIEAYLERCIESIIGQTYKELDIILVDDGSTDHSPDICDKYALEDCRIRVIHKDNGGLVSARKAGTSIAVGDYIMNVDGDDWIEPERIQHLVEKGISEGADMIYMSGLWKEYISGGVLCKTNVPVKTYYADEVIDGLFPLFSVPERCFKNTLRANLWMWAVKRELLQEKQQMVDDRITIAEDYICIWFCLLDAKTVTVIEEAGYHYIQQRTSAMTYLPVGMHSENIKIWFRQMQSCLQMHHAYERLKSIWISLAAMCVVLSDYNMVLEMGLDFLYPFLKIQRGQRIAVYGAGKFGRSIVEVLRDEEDFPVTLWVDKNEKESPISGFHIYPIETLKKKDNYDYIAIAVIDADLAEKIEKQLIGMGIEKEKIARMDASMVREYEQSLNNLLNNRS